LSSLGRCCAADWLLSAWDELPAASASASPRAVACLLFEPCRAAVSSRAVCSAAALACAALLRRDRLRSLPLPLMLLSQPAGMNTPVPALGADSDGGLSSLAIALSCKRAACSRAHEGHPGDHA
jgi:hypothetical protein